tara:strand:- start:2809 stop:4713 length:1905 start_codon:yes stop_codon:yes gene_type:complete
MDKEIAEIRKKAKVVAEATGRSVDAVIDDLMDDGIVNLSNEENKEKNLVEQLKEAAELITTVQSISQEVSENTVLNGGENSTEVKVETTLEGDIVDRAIESLQKKADNIKKLGLTLVPIFLLITGGSMEAIGLIDLMPTEVNGGEDGCDPMWGYDEYGYLDGNNLEVRFTFQDYMNCGIEHFGGHFIITLFESGDETEQVFINNIDFIDYISIEHTFMGLEGGDYHYRVEFHVVECEDGSCEHGDEYYLPTSNDYYIEVVEVIGCDAYLINEQAYLLESDPEKVQISADVALVEEENNCDSEQFEITWRLYQGDVVKYEHKTYEDGIVTDPDGADYTNHIWDFVDEGTYTPRVILKLNGEILDEKWISHSINREAEPIYGCTDDSATNYDSLADNDDGSCEYPPEEPCEVGIHNHYRGHVGDDIEQDAILIAFKVIPENCEGENIFIEIDLFQNGYTENYSHQLTVVGDTDTDVSHIFDGVAIGNSWIPRITATVDGEQKELINFWGIDVVAQEPEICEINLFGITLLTNNTTATVAFDLDCGYEENDLEGYNVSVQFLVYEIGSSNNTAQPIIWETTLCYIEGYADDIRTLLLDNFTSNNTTHYDFYWYATWTDGDGDMQFIERKWLNRELSP